MTGYVLIRADHPSNSKRGCVCLGFNKWLSLKVLTIIIFSGMHNVWGYDCEQTYNLIILYRSTSQTKDRFENSRDDCELNLESIVNKNPFLTTVLGGFNARSNVWYKNDIATFEGYKIDITTSRFSLSQIKNELKYLLNNTSSCIDLIFTSQLNLVMYSRVDSSLHQNYHYQIVFSKFSLKIHIPLYKRFVCHYQPAIVWCLPP